MKSILFVCAGNTCRSMMAEYIARDHYSGVQFQSAGLSPQLKQDAENACYTLGKMGIDASTHVPSDVSERDLSAYDIVIAMDKQISAQILTDCTPPEHAYVAPKISRGNGHHGRIFDARDVMRWLSRFEHSRAVADGHSE